MLCCNVELLKVGLVEVYLVSSQMFVDRVARFHLFEYHMGLFEHFDSMELLKEDLVELRVFYPFRIVDKGAQLPLFGYHNLQCLHLSLQSYNVVL